MINSGAAWTQALINQAGHSTTAIDPIKLPDVARLLEACAAREELDPISQKMLADLAAGLTLLGSAQVKSN
jgi:hypothetical protein